jgi:hypothetical protein
VLHIFSSVALNTKFGSMHLKGLGQLADTMIVAMVGNWWVTCMLDILHYM